MRLCVATLLLSGCQLVWNPSSYRGDGGSDDASADAPVSDAGDASTDSMMDTAVDALDASSDVFDAGCAVDRATMILDDEDMLVGARIVVDGDAPAIEIAGDDVTLRDVEIIVEGDSPGIVVSGWGASLTDVRIVKSERAIARTARHAIEVSADVTGLTIVGLEVQGMLGISADGTVDADFIDVHVYDPVSAAPTDRRAILCNRCAGAEFVGVSVIGMPGELDYALSVSGEGMRLENIYLSSTTDDLISGSAALHAQCASEACTMDEVQVWEAQPGIHLRGTGSWTLTNVHVGRVEGCDVDDFAFRTSDSGSHTCIECTAEGTCSTEAVGGDGSPLSVSVETAGKVPLDPLPFCFTRSDPTHSSITR